MNKFIVFESVSRGQIDSQKNQKKQKNFVFTFFS